MSEFDDDISVSLDWVAYAAMRDARLADNNELRSTCLACVRQLSAALALPLPAERLQEMADWEATRPRHRTYSTKGSLSSIMLYLNPEGYRAPTLRSRYFPTLSETMINSTRNALRTLTHREAKPLGSSPTIVRTQRGEHHRYMRPVPEPMHPATGLHYFELFDADPTNVAALHANEHTRSPWYRFHAQAWARRIYADYLETYHWSECPYTKLTPYKLRLHNPENGSGPAYLFLAFDFILRERSNTITLPVPFLQCNAHEVDDFGLKRNQAASIRTFEDMTIAKLRDDFGIKSPRIGDNREVLDLHGEPADQPSMSHLLTGHAADRNDAPD